MMNKYAHQSINRFSLHFNCIILLLSELKMPYLIMIFLYLQGLNISEYIQILSKGSIPGILLTDKNAPSTSGNAFPIDTQIALSYTMVDKNFVSLLASETVLCLN